MNMKLSLLAASLVALGGCVAPGYYVQPDGYYSDGYYYDEGGYDSAYYDGCCYSGSVSIGFGYGYGYPGYYGYPYDYYGGYYYYDRYHHHHGDWDGHHGDDHWNHGGYDHDDHVDPAVARWPDKQPWRVPDHPRVPHWNTMTQSGGQIPQPQTGSPHFTPHYHSDSGASAHEPPRSWTPPPRTDKPKPQQF